MGRPRSFTARGHLSRPSGLCFDGRGDLCVTDMSGRVLRFAGPGRPQPGAALGVLLDATLLEHGLAPPGNRLPPKQFDIGWWGGLFFVTTHTCCMSEGEEQDHGRLSVWSQRGALLRVHTLTPHRHPNMFSLFCCPPAAQQGKSV